MVMDAEKLKYVVDVNSTIEEAWSQIEVNRHRSVIIVDNGKVVGTLSDGDLRKAMLAHRLLSAPVREAMNTNFTALTEHKKARAKAILREKDIFLMPIVDKQMKLLDVIIR
jgi:CBS domain-containing protein